MAAVRAAAMAPLRAGVRMVLARPRLKQVARRLLTLSPRLHARLHALMFRATASAARTSHVGKLSVRADRIYRNLKRAAAARGR